MLAHRVVGSVAVVRTSVSMQQQRVSGVTNVRARGGGEMTINLLDEDDDNDVISGDVTPSLPFLYSCYSLLLFHMNVVESNAVSMAYH